MAHLPIHERLILMVNHGSANIASYMDPDPMGDSTTNLVLGLEPPIKKNNSSTLQYPFPPFGMKNQLLLYGIVILEKHDICWKIEDPQTKSPPKPNPPPLFDGTLLRLSSTFLFIQGRGNERRRLHRGLSGFPPCRGDVIQDEDARGGIFLKNRNHRKTQRGFHQVYRGESSWIDLALWGHLWLNGTTNRMEITTKKALKLFSNSKTKWSSCQVLVLSDPFGSFIRYLFQGWFLWPPFGGSSLVTNGRSWWTKITTQSLKQVSHEKNLPTFHYTGCSKGIHIMVYYNPHITGQYFIPYIT